MKKIDKMRGFLLGTLSDREREEVEKSILSDDGLYELLLAVEAEIVDESLRGELSPGDDRSFRQYLVRTPGGASRLELARGLLAALDSTDVPSGEPVPADIRPPARWMASFAWAAGFAILLVGGLAAEAILSLRARVSQLDDQVSRAEAREAELAAQLREAREENEKLEGAPEAFEPRAAPRQASPSRPRAAIPVLSAGILRGGGTLPTISIPRGETAVQVSLDLGAHSHDTYRAVLHDVDARELIAVNRLTARVDSERISVLLTIPATSLEAGDYYVLLSGVGVSGDPDPIARYDFRISIE